MLDQAIRHRVVQEDLESILASDLPWENLAGKTVWISGAAGFLPAYMVETLLLLNEQTSQKPVRVVGLVRNLKRAHTRFAAYQERGDLELIEHDITQPLPTLDPPDVIVHAASQASPKYYASDPVGTLSANVLGSHYLLERGRECRCESFLFFSSSEIYGARADARTRDSERQFGAVDPLDRRACYAESKRMGETMCAAWWRQFGVPARIVRPFHTYGPGMRLDDGRVFCDFVAYVVNRRPIVLKSAGASQRAFCYLADAVEGFFTVLLKGKSGEAYNVGNDRAKCTVRELAELLVRWFPDRELEVIHQPRQSEDPYLASATNHPLLDISCPDISKIGRLGWSPSTALDEGFRRTVRSFE